MARFLNTSALNYGLEKLIIQARKRIVLISPYLKFHERIKSLLATRDKEGVQIEVIYGKRELAPQTAAWLRSLEHVRVSFCQNLHAKCYIFDNQAAILTSMNLYEYSQVNNYEMGILVLASSSSLSLQEDGQLLASILQEVELIRQASTVMLAPAESIDHFSTAAPSKEKEQPPSRPSRKSTAPSSRYNKLTTYRLAQARNTTKPALLQRLAKLGYIRKQGKDWTLTAKGKQIGGEMRSGKDGSTFFLWPRDLEL